jgi:hypothetical protein
MEQNYVVVRSFEKDGRTLAPGTVVNVEGWAAMRVRQMVDQRYLAPVEVEKPKAGPKLKAS